MARYFDENILNDILNKINIVEVIGEHIALKRAGRNFKALCPFHKEKTPSFIVSPDKQIYHCFGCGVGGNAFQFLMDYQHLNFMEAVQILAAKSGVKLPEKKSGSHLQRSLTNLLFDVNCLAKQFFCSVLFSNNGKKARDYLEARGISLDTAKNFHLGYSPDRWEALIEYARSKKVSISLLEKAGLIIAKEKKGYYDRFRGRIIFPIIDQKGNCLGFGGRLLDEGLPKYINSPETPIYKKGNCLYGLNLAKEAIRKKGVAIVVEGYFDCITPYQYGMQNIVASLGTALTVEQLRLLKRYCSSVVLLFDGDLAGEIATLRSLDIFVEEDMQVSIASLPKGFDPDSLTHKYGIGTLEQLVNDALPLFDYKLNVLRQRYNERTAEGKAAIVHHMLITINKFKNAIVRLEYRRRLSEELDVDEEAIAQEMSLLVKKLQDEDSLDKTINKPAIQISPTEKLIMKLLIEEDALITKIRQKLNPDDFESKEACQLFSTLYKLASEGKTISTGILLEKLSDTRLATLVREAILLPDISCEEREKVLEDCIRRIKKRRMQSECQRLQEKIREAEKSGDMENVKKLEQEFYSLVKKGYCV